MNDSLTQQKLETIFSTLRKIHNCHWKTPKLEVVKSEIARTGAFIFRAGSNPWVAEIKITDNKIQYTINNALPEKMRIKVEEMKKNFDKLIVS